MPKAPAPYLTREPWLPFTPREKLRTCPLKACPSSKCRRAKVCIDAHDNLYCQRSHESMAQHRQRTGYTEARPRTHDYSDGELEALRELAEQKLADIAILKRERVAQ